MKSIILFISLSPWLVGCVSFAEANRTTQKEQLLLRDMDIQFDLDTAKRGADGWAGYFAQNGSMVLGKGPPITGPQAIHQVMQKAFANPGTSLRWKPQKSEMLIPGSLGYTIGRYERRSLDKDGKTNIQVGTYVSIWKKQQDGTWKILLDTGEPD